MIRLPRQTTACLLAWPLVLGLWACSTTTTPDAVVPLAVSGSATGGPGPGLGPAAPATMSWKQLSTLPVPPTPVAERIAYGPAPQQVLRLRLPPGATPARPAPLVWLLHGGCWQNEYSADYFEPLAAWLAGQGYATANLEYRRIGDPGGGWPGTFDDLRAAVALLPSIAASHPGLDATRTVAVGHSAGGHLALWMMQEGLVTRGAVGLAAIADLTAYGANARPDSCGSSVAGLMGGTAQQFPDRYQAVDPALHRPAVPAGFGVVLLTGSADPIVPAAQAASFLAAASAGIDACRVGTARRQVLPNLGHFDMAAPAGTAGQALVAALGDLLGPGAP